MVKYLKSKDGKFAGSIGDGKNSIPTGVGHAPIPLHELTEPLTEYEISSVEGMKRNILDNSADGTLIDMTPSKRASDSMPQVPGLFIEQVRIATVGFEDGSGHKMPVGATGSWHGYPFQIGPSATGAGTVFALYPYGSDEKKTAPMTVTVVNWGAGISEVAEVLPAPLLTSMFRLSLTSLWEKKPQVAEKFNFPGVTRPQPAKKGLFSRVFGR